MKHIPFYLAFLVSGTLCAQNLTLPAGNGWRTLAEGQELVFAVSSPDSITTTYSIEGANGYGIQFDTLGRFYWKPSFDLVDRLEKQKEIAVIFQAASAAGKIREAVTFVVVHTNRPPEIEDLPSFYVKQATFNQYQISSDYVRDPDGDPLTFKSVPSSLPEGASLSSLGLLSWTPSRNQFLGLKANPIFIEFMVQDPDRMETRTRIKVAQTQLDLPPELLLVPGDTVYSIKEDDRLNVKLYVTDPNGDDNVTSVAFVCADNRIIKNNLKENSPVQSEFTWSPGYQFVEEAEKSREVEIIFFALDKSTNRVEEK